MLCPSQETLSDKEAYEVVDMLVLWQRHTCGEVDTAGLLAEVQRYTTAPPLTVLETLAEERRDSVAGVLCAGAAAAAAETPNGLSTPGLPGVQAVLEGLTTSKAKQVGCSQVRGAGMFRHSLGRGGARGWHGCVSSAGYVGLLPCCPRSAALLPVSHPRLALLHRMSACVVCAVLC